jgi:YidC/Oxa1 family membrane protein insertase
VLRSRRVLLSYLAIVVIFALSRIGAARPLVRIPPTLSSGNLSSLPLTPYEQFGRVAPIAWPLYLALRFFYEHLAHNWGAAIILFTVIFNLLLVWTRVKSLRSAAKMKSLQPRVKALQDRYRPLAVTDPNRAALNTEIMALYRSEGVNMLSGCLPILLQIPLLFGLFSVLRNANELHHASWLWLSDLAMPDPLHILPVVIIAAMTFTQLITPSPGIDPVQRRVLAVITAIVFGSALWQYAAGLSLYWATGNLVNLVTQFVIKRSSLNGELRRAANP